MAASPSKEQIRAALNGLAKKNPGVTYVVLRASNGEVAILPEGRDANGNLILTSGDKVKGYVCSCGRAHAKSTRCEEIR